MKQVASGIEKWEDETRIVVSLFSTHYLKVINIVRRIYMLCLPIKSRIEIKSFSIIYW